MRILALLLASTIAAFADGTVQQTISQLGTGDTWVVSFDWTGDAANGSVPATLAKIGNQLQGYRIVSLDAAPGNPAPTNGYSVTIKSSLAIDCFAGTVNSLGSGTGSSFAASQSCSPINGSFTFALTGNTVASAKGKIVVYVQKPTLVVQGQLATTVLNLLNFADIRNYGAICDTTDQNTAVQKAITAGYSNLFFPKLCTWVVPGNTVPANLVIVGEDWITSVIKSAADPTTSALYIGSHTQIYRMNLEGNACSPATNCPTASMINGNQTRTFIATPYSAMQANGDSGYDHAPVQVRQYGSGDAIYVEAIAGSNGVGLRAYNSDTTGVALLAGRLSTGAALSIQDINSSAATGTMSQWFSPFKTSGEMISLVQRTSAFTGAGMLMNMADTGGSFTGQFLDLRNGGVQKFLVNSQATVFFGDTASVSVRTGTNTPEGAIAAPVGSLYLRANGGAGTSLYVKESGAGGVGWVGK